MNRRMLAIAAGVAVAILVVWYFALWAPRSKTLKNERERAETAEQARDTARAQVERLRAAQRNEPALRAQLEGLRSAIPDQPNLAQFILDTNDAAVRAGIDFISIAPTLPAPPAPATGAAPAPPPATPGAPPTGPAPAEIKIQLQISGGYFQVLDFLNRLDALPRLVVTDNLNVSSDAAARLTVGAAVRMFLAAVPPEYGGAAGAPGAPAPGGTTPTSVPAGAVGATTTTAPGTATTAPVTPTSSSSTTAVTPGATTASSVPQ